MNYDEIVKLAEDAGLNENRARIAAAIALAESGGDPNLVTDDSDDLSYGLWQINMKGPLGPQRRHDFGLPSNTTLLDPRRNAFVMAALSKDGGNFNAWTTYTSGKYKKFLKDKSITDRAGDLINGLQDAGSNVVTNAEAAATAATNIAQALQKTAAWISDSKNWVRILYVAGGSFIVIIGLYEVARSAGGPGKSAHHLARTSIRKATNAGKRIATGRLGSPASGN